MAKKNQQKPRDENPPELDSSEAVDPVQVEVDPITEKVVKAIGKPEGKIKSLPSAHQLEADYAQHPKFAKFKGAKQ